MLCYDIQLVACPEECSFPLIFSPRLRSTIFPIIYLFMLAIENLPLRIKRDKVAGIIEEA
jgi:hypothetical protein